MFNNNADGISTLNLEFIFTWTLNWDHLVKFYI